MTYLRIISILICFCSLGFSGPSLGVIWSKNSFKKNPHQKLVFERKVISEIENQGMQKVVRPPFPLEVSSELIENERYSGKNWFKKLSPQLFGPEVERGYLSKAWESWILGRRGNAEELIVKAINGNPFAQPSLLIPEEEKVENHLFEVEVSSILNRLRTTPICSIEVNVNSDSSLWINGYPLSEREFKIKKGLFLLVMRDSKSQLFERILRCDGKSKELNLTGWIPIKSSVPRLEMVLPSEWETMDDVLVLQEVGGEVLKWTYQRGKGLTEWKALNRKKWEGDSRVYNPNPLFEASTPHQEKKWYTIPKLLGWVLGVAGTGFLILQVTDRPDLNQSVPLVLK